MKSRTITIQSSAGGGLALLSITNMNRRTPLVILLHNGNEIRVGPGRTLTLEPADSSVGWRWKARVPRDRIMLLLLAAQLAMAVVGVALLYWLRRG
jgi:hypothetical protein